MENQNPNNLAGQQTINVQIPSADNIARRRTLIPFSFTVAIIFFMFTFCDFNCGGQKLGSIKGIDLVTGTTIKDYDRNSRKETKGENVPSSIWAIFAFGAAIIGLGAFLIKEKRESIIGTGAGMVGACSLIILQFVIKSAIDEKGKGQIECDFQLPYWGALIALGLAGLISYLRMKNKYDIVINTSPPALKSKEDIVHSQVQQIPTFQLTSEFDVIAYFQTNKKFIIGILILSMVSFGVYRLFLQHDPTNDGQKVAMEHCNCNKENTELSIKVYENFIANFYNYKFSKRSVGHQMLDSSLKIIGDSSQRCYDNYQLERTKYMERYVINKEQLEKFNYAANAQIGLCKNERKSILTYIQEQAIEKLQSIKDIEADVNDFIRNEMGVKWDGNKWKVKTDNDSKWDEFSYDNFILPERRKSEYFPYIVKGDFDNNGTVDFAAIVRNSDNTNERIAIGMNNKRLYWREESSDAISFFPCTELRNLIENVNNKNIIGDGISVIAFESSSYVIYWNGSDFQEYWTSD